MFAYTYNDLGCCNILAYTINTNTESPIYIPRYRKSICENLIIAAEVEAKIIQPSESPWSSSIVLVPKPDGLKRFCVDYRRINAVTIPDQFRLPLVQDILNSLSGSLWFSTLDLKSGYWQTELDKESRDVSLAHFSDTSTSTSIFRIFFLT